MRAVGEAAPADANAAPEPLPTPAAQAGSRFAPAIEAGELLGGVDPERLAEAFGTPLYVYDLDAVERRAVAVRGSLPSRFDLAYAVKANPSLAVVATLARAGLGADVASAGELETALRAGVRPADIVMTGPGKRDDELAAAIAAGVRAVTVESIGELERLADRAAAAGRSVPVLLRLAAGEPPRAAGGQGEPPRSGPGAVLHLDDGVTGKFGMDEDEIADAARLALGRRSVELLGIHAFGVSNVTDAAAFAASVAATVEAGRRLAADVGFELRVVDAGGGLGIPYAAGDPSLDLDELARLLAGLDLAWASDPRTAGTHVVLEPGRYLVGPAGAYLVRVVATKTLRGRRVAIVDGGIHHALRPALVRSAHRVVAIGRPSQDRDRPSEPAEHGAVTVGGPLCTGIDLFASDARLGACQVGDLLAVLDLGAYGFTESMPLFLSHPTPAEVGIRAGEPRLLRPRQEPASWLAGQLLPDW